MIIFHAFSFCCHYSSFSDFAAPSLDTIRDMLMILLFFRLLSSSSSYA